jgi:hypothetical protein
MFSILKKSAPALATFIALAGVAALPTAAVARDEASAAEASAAEKSAPVSSVSGQTVVRDGASGQMRSATAEEAHALHAKGQSHAFAQRRALATAVSRAHSSGAQGARLTDEFMTYSVLVRQPDGRLVSICFDSKEEAEAAVKAAPVVKTATAPTE